MWTYLLWGPQFCPSQSSKPNVGLFVIFCESHLLIGPLVWGYKASLSICSWPFDPSPGSRFLSPHKAFSALCSTGRHGNDIRRAIGLRKAPEGCQDGALQHVLQTAPHVERQLQPTTGTRHLTFHGGLQLAGASMCGVTSQS